MAGVSEILLRMHHNVYKCFIRADDSKYANNYLEIQLLSRRNWCLCENWIKSKVEKIHQGEFPKIQAQLLLNEGGKCLHC